VYDPLGFDWPLIVKSCAQVIGVQLDPLSAVGTKVTWSLPYPGLATIVAGGTDDTLRGTADAPTASLIYQTGTETPDQAQGAEDSSTMFATATLDRKTSDQIRPILEKVIGAALSGLDPSISALIAGVGTDLLDKLIDVTNPTWTSPKVTIHFHDAPPPTTLPETTTTQLPAGCVGTRLLSDPFHAVVGGTGVDVPGSMLMMLNPDGSGVLDADGTAQFVTEAGQATLRGQLQFTWTSADGANFVAGNAHGELTIEVFSAITGAVTVPIGAEDFLGNSEALTCTGGVLTVNRTTQTFHPDTGATDPSAGTTVPG